MCCCGRAVVNGEFGYKWQPNEAPSIRPVDPPALGEDDHLLLDLPGRCGGLDSHSHHYRLVNSSGLVLLVRHGGGDARLRLSGPLKETLMQLDPTSCYWLLNAVYHAYADGRQRGSEKATDTWRRAAAEKRIKTRKERGSDSVKVWIQPAVQV